MGGKKKKGGKKKGKGKKKAAGGEKSAGPAPLALPEDDTCWVTLDMQLVNWVFLNFQLRVKTSTPVYSIKRQLVERHGQMHDLRLFREHKSDATELKDEMQTLEEAGIGGAPKDADELTVPIVYDFKPDKHDDALLLVNATRDLEDEEDLG